MSIPSPQRDAIEELLQTKKELCKPTLTTNQTRFKTSGRNLIFLGISRPRNKSDRQVCIAVFGFKDQASKRPQLPDANLLETCGTWVLVRPTTPEESQRTGCRDAVELLEPWAEQGDYKILQPVGQPAFYNPVSPGC